MLNVSRLMAPRQLHMMPTHFYDGPDAVNIIL